jgi:hypothetical protein
MRAFAKRLRPFTPDSGVHPREEQSMRKTMIMGLVLGVVLTWSAQNSFAGAC